MEQGVWNWASVGKAADGTWVFHAPTEAWRSPIQVRQAGVCMCVWVCCIELSCTGACWGNCCPQGRKPWELEITTRNELRCRFQRGSLRIVQDVTLHLPLVELDVTAVKALTANRVSVFWGKSGEIPWNFLKTWKANCILCILWSLFAYLNAKMAQHDVTVLFREMSDFHFSAPPNGQQVS